MGSYTLNDPGYWTRWETPRNALFPMKLLLRNFKVANGRDDLYVYDWTKAVEFTGEGIDRAIEMPEGKTIWVPRDSELGIEIGKVLELVRLKAEADFKAAQAKAAADAKAATKAPKA